MEKRKPYVMIVVNAVSNLLNFRHELILALIDRGYGVVIVSPSGTALQMYEQMGCKVVVQAVNRHGRNVIQDMTLMMKYFQVIQEWKPFCILTYTIKPNLYAGLAARMLRVPYLIHITGLGIAFSNKSFMTSVIIHMYRRVLKHAKCVFFQNKSNRQTFIRLKIPFRHSVVLPGSGVNLSFYKKQEYPTDDGVFRLLFISRIMKDKGIHEVVNAARILGKKYGNIEFHILGACEDDYAPRMEEWAKEKNIIYHGAQKDTRPFMKQCDCLIHPSYHEGMSNVCLEAAATARPILASNIPGCREIFDEGISGIGFEPRNVSALVKAIETYIRIPYAERKRMGEKARKKVEEKFDRKFVINAYMDELECLEAMKNDYC